MCVKDEDVNEMEFQLRRQELVDVQHREAEKVRQRLESEELEAQTQNELDTTDALEDNSPQVCSLASGLN